MPLRHKPWEIRRGLGRKSLEGGRFQQTRKRNAKEPLEVGAVTPGEE